MIADIFEFDERNKEQSYKFYASFKEMSSTEAKDVKKLLVEKNMRMPKPSEVKIYLSSAALSRLNSATEDELGSIRKNPWSLLNSKNKTEKTTNEDFKKGDEENFFLREDFKAGKKDLDEILNKKEPSPLDNIETYEIFEGYSNKLKNILSASDDISLNYEVIIENLLKFFPEDHTSFTEQEILYNSIIHKTGISDSDKKIIEALVDAEIYKTKEEAERVRH